MKNTQSGDVVLNRLGKGIHITCSQTRLYRDNVNMYRIMELIFFQREQSIKWIRRKNTLLSLWNMSVINLKQCDARLMHTILSVMQHFIMLNGNNHTRSSFCSINHFFFFLPSWYRIKICSVCEINMWSSVNYFMGKTVKSSETRVKGLSPDGAWKTSKWHHNNLVTGQQTKLMLVLSILKHALCIWMHFVMPKNGPETQIVWSFSIEFSFNKTRSNVLFFFILNNSNI